MVKKLKNVLIMSKNIFTDIYYKKFKLKNSRAPNGFEPATPSPRCEFWPFPIKIKNLHKKTNRTNYSSINFTKIGKNTKSINCIHYTSH